MLLFGATGDKYSRRGALLLGLGVFGGGAVFGSLADSATTGTAGMVGGTAALALLTEVDASSSYGDFVALLIVPGLAIGLALSPATDAIMGAFPESELGVGGAVNDTSIELGGSLGIADPRLAAGDLLLGPPLRRHGRKQAVRVGPGRKVQAQQLATGARQMKDSVGAGYAVAQGVGDGRGRLVLLRRGGAHEPDRGDRAGRRDGPGGGAAAGSQGSRRGGSGRGEGTRRRPLTHRTLTPRH